MNNAYFFLAGVGCGLLLAIVINRHGRRRAKLDTFQEMAMRQSGQFQHFGINEALE